MTRLLVVLVYTLLIFIAPRIHAEEIWDIDANKSSLSFEFILEGDSYSGRFESFYGDIRFNPAALAQSQFEITIETNSITTDNADQDDTLRSADFFHIAAWPEAQFKTLSIESVGPEQYQASAELKIRSTKLTIPFEFSLRIMEEKGRRVFYAEGHATLDRLAFGLGLGDWADTEAIGAAVKVNTSIRAVSSSIIE